MSINILDDSLTFRERLVQEYSRKELIELLHEQNPEIVKGVRRIEWVFANKLSHLTWRDGTPIKERPFTIEELALLVDEPFVVDQELTKIGLSPDQQYQLHIARDPVLWARHMLKVEPRAYQILILRYPSLRKVLRAGRRLGKTFTLAVILLHYSFTHKDGRCLVVAPMKTHVELIYDEIMRLAQNSVVGDSITRNITSPQFIIEFTNGSSIKFFTSGIRSGGKADVARGQEAHIIVLDELDYMSSEDLVSLYAMLQKTAENQEDKVLVGASTPSGQRSHFYQWCSNKRFKEFWFPSYVSPFFTREVEQEFHDQYTDMAYRHEIEADWGEDTEGVYPRRYLDRAFGVMDWKYIDKRTSARSFYIIGVDWDKYGAGVNIVVLEACGVDYEIEVFQDKLRVCYREEVPKGEYTLTDAIDRVIQLNANFNPKWIYIDRGYGEGQYEMLKKFGVEHPETGLAKKVIGVSFSETLEVPDPSTKMMTKKQIKPFMVENLRSMLEQGSILLPTHDEELYIQLLSYVVIRTTTSGRPVFESGAGQVDHAHDALIMACLAYTQNYSDLMHVRRATRSIAISNEAFLPTFEVDTQQDAVAAMEAWESPTQAPISVKRSMTSRRASISRPLHRKIF